MSEIDTLEELSEQLSRRTERKDGRGDKIGSRKLNAAIARGALSSALARRRKVPITLAKVSLPE